MACNVLYDHEQHYKKLTQDLLKALAFKRTKQFLESLVSTPYIQKLVRFTPDESDSESDVTKSRNELLKDLDNILKEWDAKHPTHLARTEMLSKIYEALNVSDRTQPAVRENEEDKNDLKTKAEIQDQNSANLNEHIQEFYGLSSFDIVASMKQRFKDLLDTAAYYDMESGTVAIQTNETLNSSIRRQKAALFKTLVSYLKSEYTGDPRVADLSENMYTDQAMTDLDMDNYHKVLSRFYNLEAITENFKDKLQTANAKKIQGIDRQTRSKEYEKLVTRLEGNKSFKDAMDRKFAGGKRLRVGTNLFTADHFSEYYSAVKKWILENDPSEENIKTLTKIETPKIDVLDAANAYTILNHFDSLLRETYGDEIKCISGTFGFESNINDKYFYHQDTTHENKSWQTSESIGTEKHTSKLTNAIIGMIRIYDHNTGEFMNRRLDSTSLVVAARNVLNALVHDKLEFTISTKSAIAAINELKLHAVQMHNNPIQHLQSLLEILFERQPNVKESLVTYMKGNNMVSDYDLSILKSLYDVVFNKNNPKSFFKQNLENTFNFIQANQNILEEVAGFVDRNVTVAYLETIYDFETGAPTVRAKKKFFNTKQLYKLQTRINTHINGMSDTKRAELRRKYGTDNGIQIFTKDGWVNYVIKLDGEDVTIQVPTGLSSQILGQNLNKGSKMKFDDPGKLFNRLADINLVEFRSKVEKGEVLTGDEKTLYSLLSFLDDTLDLGILANPNWGLQVLQSYKQIYRTVDNFDNFLMPLVKLGIRAAYVNDQYLDAQADGKSLENYLRDHHDPVYEANNPLQSKIFSKKYNNLKYRIASYADTALGIWTDAQSILNGEASKATTKDKQGNSIPNNSVAKLGGILHYYLDRQEGTNMESLLLVRHPELIETTFHDLEVTNMQNDSSSIRSFSNGELFYHAIFNKFWASYLQHGTLIIQPTTYSDKTTFLNWELKAKLESLNLGNIDLAQASPDQIIKLYAETVGEAYQKSFDHTVDKLKRVTSAFLAANPELDQSMNYKQVLRHMNQAKLAETIIRLNKQYEADGHPELKVDMEKNKDYVILKDKNGNEVLGVNGTLEYNSILFNDSEKLRAKLNREKSLFLEQLLFNGCAYQVLEGNDTLDMYTDDKNGISGRARSRNPIISTINQLYANNESERAKYMAKWVDEDTGKLILAKQSGRDIISISDGFNGSLSFELNPLFDKFFYTEGLLSNNLRFSLTGFEVNHPSGKKSPLSKVLKVKNVVDLNKALHSNLTPEDFALLHNDTNTGVFDRILDVDDLTDVLNTNEIPHDSELYTVLSKLAQDTYDYSINTAQGTQFKRNVIIPATLQYVQQNVKDGVPPRIKCAVIEDTKASVFNYKGTVEDDIDATDGLALITAFQSILENRALGSQAVGFTKKPIWHDYDEASGTAFLAKFATNTMTNETMRMSLLSKGPHYRLFKKATNLQWNPNDNIDLTKSLVRAASLSGVESMGLKPHDLWFNSVILQNGQLFYKDKYGEIQQITGFDKSDSENGPRVYYTKERKAGDKHAEEVKRFHVYYDDAGQTSIHEVFDTSAAARKRMAELNAQGKNAHTINSLFELHDALGGIQCVDSKGNGSEFNNEVVVNFMCNVGSVKTGNGRGQNIDQTTYTQPLKDYHIGYLLNNTSVKNGAKNVNPKEAWLDDSELAYFEVRSDGLGMQMNADHDIVNSELTEFSQVIAATAAYGYTYNNCYELFKGLAFTAFQTSEKLIKATDHFLEQVSKNRQEEAASELYDSLGRIMFMNQNIKDSENLTNIIMQAVEKTFNKFKDHSNDTEKIPFSDPNIYSDFIATIATTITKSSIKRKHPGTGAVMVGAYNMAQYFELRNDDGSISKMMAPDVLKRAQTEYRNELIRALTSTEAVEQFNVAELNDSELVDVEFHDKPWKNRPWESNRTIRVYLKGQHNKGYFELVKDHEYGFYSVHFKTGNPETGSTEAVVNPETGETEYGSTKEERALLYDAILKALPEGARLSTWGEVSDGGVKALSRLGDGLKQVGTRKVKNRQGQDLEIPIFLKGTAVDMGHAKYRSMTTQQLEQALSEQNPSLMPEYYTPNQSAFEASQHFVRVYLNRRQKAMPVHTNQDFFIPSDNVEIYDADGNHVASIELDDLGKYYKFKEGILEKGTRVNGTVLQEDTQMDPSWVFRQSTITPYNLRPSLIRWQYRRGGTGELRYMNFFDLEVVRHAYKESLKGKDGRVPANQKTLVQDILHNLVENGTFIDPYTGNEEHIEPGTLENTAAELIMSNIYKDTFGIENESLADVLEKGEEFFVEQSRKLYAPATPIYDMAFLRDSGEHTLITIGNVIQNDQVQQVQFNNIMTNQKDEIVTFKHGREMFEIGRWNEVRDVRYDAASGKFISDTRTNLDKTKFRVKDGVVQERFDYVTQYTVLKPTETKNKGIVYKTYTLYKIADVNTFKQALGKWEGDQFIPAEDFDASKQQSSIINKIYSEGDYKMAQLNSAKHIDQGKRNALKGALQFMLTNWHLNPDVKEVLEQQLDTVGTNKDHNFKEFERIKETFLRKEAHRKWVSFQDSLNFISSRIPAQTLQSFMAMKLVAWTENSKNMAYVSHFQTFLQGSDYDIDKAYIMGQNYDSNSVYVNWSPYFDYTSLKTLTVSKALPVPKRISIALTETGTDVTSLMDTLVSNSKIVTIDEVTKQKLKTPRLSTSGLDEDTKVAFLTALGNLIRTAEKADGKISYSGTMDEETQKIVLNTIKLHEDFRIAPAVAEAAYKNVASANIYAVSHDIRNRDQAYTAISMDLMRRAADKSPKGEQASKLNMLNPLTKYIMQYQNLVGKDVIGITANGEKFWFNLYYYWTHVLNTGTPEDLRYLQFSQTLNRVQDRSKSTEYQIICEANTVTHIPDLNVRDTMLKEKLMDMFGATEGSMQYRYVDQTISQLLSSATDNAKELILAKINAGTNYAKMYLYLITMGYNIDDIAAFMYSPMAEFIDSRSHVNMFQNNSGFGGPTNAIRSALGQVSSKSFLHGVYSEINEETNELEYVSKIEAVAAALAARIYEIPELTAAIMTNLELQPDQDLSLVKLDNLMQALIQEAVKNPRLAHGKKDFNLRTFFGVSEDAETNNYIRHCQDLLQQLYGVRSQYKGKTDEMFADAKEFKKIYDLASEMSSIASAYLGLNQGLPSDKISILKRLNSMRKVVTDRESAMDIRAYELFMTKKDKNGNDKALSEEDLARQTANRAKVINNLLENNPELTEDEIWDTLEMAYNEGIMNKFDVYRMLTEEDYKNKVKEYVHVIKGTANVIDMMDKIPHYNEIMKLFRSLLVGDNAMSLKSRMINSIVESGRNISNEQFEGIVRFVDNTNIVDFLEATSQSTTNPEEMIKLVRDLVPKGEAKGFNTEFDLVPVEVYKLDTIEGTAGFKRFVETEFYDYLKDNYADNPLVNHLIKQVSEGKTILTVDIDLMSPNTTSSSRIAYDEILRGTAAFEGVAYNEDYTIADILQLYNLIVNKNRYGSERFTTMFKACTSPDGLMQRYLKFTANRDFSTTIIPDYEMQDYKINAAPMISSSVERFHSEEYVKVKDPIWDYVLKKYDSATNSYSEFSLLPEVKGHASPETIMQRRINYAEYSPFDMPARWKQKTMMQTLTYNGELTEQTTKALRDLLIDLSKSGKILITKIC